VPCPCLPPGQEPERVVKRQLAQSALRSALIIGEMLGFYFLREKSPSYSLALSAEECNADAVSCGAYRGVVLSDRRRR
jgi:hypothetical protein